MQPRAANPYIALLKLGSSNVHLLQRETKIHRTTIYDFLEKLLKKGLVSFVVKNNVRFFAAAPPEKLNEFLQEKQELVDEVLPELRKLVMEEKREVNVRVYEGEEGFKTLLNDILKTRKDLVGFGVDESRFKEKFPIITEQYFKKEEKLGIKERLLTSEKAAFVYKKKTTSYRYIPEEYFNPNPTIVYGEKVASIIWEPLNVILIENKQLADSYKKHFELLWKMARNKPENRRLK